MVHSIRIALTGASGYIGRHVLRHLEGTGYEVHAIRRQPSLAQEQTTAPTVTAWHDVDLFEEHAVTAFMKQVQPTHLLHLAWEATPGTYWHSLNNYRWVESSLRLIRSFYTHGGERFIGTGSCAEYDWHQGNPLNELRSPLSYTTTYAACKNYTHALLDKFSRQTDISYAWARLFFVYGKDEAPNRLIPSVIRSLLSGNVVPCSEGLHRRDYIHITDTVNALCTLLFNEMEGPVNIATSRAVRIRDIVSELAQRLGQPDRIQYGAITANDQDQPLVEGCTSRLNKLGWYPAVSLPEGLQSSIDWWSGQHKEKENEV